MVAKLYPHNFKLRDKWEAALAAHKEHMAFLAGAGLDVLKLIALREHLRQKSAQTAANTPPVTVKGVRQSDVLNLTPQVVISEWDAAVMALASAVKFLRTECGAIQPDCVPAPAMVLALADALGYGAGRADYRNDLRRWFFATSFMQTYSQGANTQGVTDARELRAWAADPASVPAVLKSFENTVAARKEDLRDERRRNEMLVRGIACMMNLRDARDWVQDKRFVDLAPAAKMEYHHVFPEQYLKNLNIDPDLVANYCLLLDTTNQSLRNDPPSAVVKRSTVIRTAIESCAIKLDHMEHDAWNDFIAWRTEKLTELMAEVVAQ